MKENYKFFSYLRGVIDIVVFNGAFFIAYYLKFDQLPNFSKPNQYAMLHVVSNLIYFTSAILAGIYNFEIPLSPPETKTRKVLKAYISFVFVYLLFIVATRGYHYSRIFHFYFISIGFFLLVLAELFSSLILFPYLSKHKRFKKRVLLLGAGVLGQIAYEKLKNMPGYEIVGFLDDDSEKASFLNGKYLGKISELENLLSLRKVEVDEVIIALPLDNDELIKNVVEIAERNGEAIKFILSYHRLFSTKKITLEKLMEIPVISIGEGRILYLHNMLLKRAFDIIFSLFVILFVLSWLTPLLWIIYKLFMPGPLFFVQDRVGQNNKIFKCYKFRTMKVSNNNEFTPTTKDDERVTRLGRFLRKTNIDELPQFFNVFIGDMSVVGPRAHAVPFQNKYKEFIPYLDVRQKVKPGVTGWAQVNGYRGDFPDEEKNKEWIRKRVEHDIWYIENWSFGLDIKIILMTIFKMIKGDPNAY
jgi:Undecaprenyl-phosphate glucose phosphotransferase